MGLQAPASDLPLSEPATPALSHAPLIHTPSRRRNSQIVNLVPIAFALRMQNPPILSNASRAPFAICECLVLLKFAERPMPVHQMHAEVLDAAAPRHRGYS
jgi:hypothetical protein